MGGERMGGRERGKHQLTVIDANCVTRGHPRMAVDASLCQLIIIIIIIEQAEALQLSHEVQLAQLTTY